MPRNTLVPDTDWGSQVRAFANEISAGQQEMVCVACVVMPSSDDTPPRQIALFNGTSYCLDHLRDAQRRLHPAAPSGV